MIRTSDGKSFELIMNSRKAGGRNVTLELQINFDENIQLNESLRLDKQ